MRTLVPFVCLSLIIFDPSTAQRPYHGLDCETIPFFDARRGCIGEGTYPIRGSCQNVIQCFRPTGTEELEPVKTECPTGTVFDIKGIKCEKSVETSSCDQVRCSATKRTYRQFYGYGGYSRRPLLTTPRPPPLLPDCPPENVEDEPEFGFNRFSGSNNQRNCIPRSEQAPAARPPQYTVPSQERATLGYNDQRYRTTTTTESSNPRWPANQKPERYPPLPPQPPPNRYPAQTESSPSRYPVQTEPPPSRYPVQTEPPAKRYPPPTEPPKRFPPPTKPPASEYETTTRISTNYGQVPAREPDPQTKRPYVNSDNPPPRKDYPPEEKYSSTTERYYEQEQDKSTVKPHAPHKHPSTVPPPPEEDEDYDDLPVAAQQGAEQNSGAKVFENTRFIAVVLVLVAWL